VKLNNSLSGQNVETFKLKQVAHVVVTNVLYRIKLNFFAINLDLYLTCICLGKAIHEEERNLVCRTQATVMSRRQKYLPKK
jgi:hypothetical protein